MTGDRHDLASHGDEVLVAKARDGDEEAFRVLFQRHAPILRARIRRRLSPALRRKVAESDVIQTAYLGVFRSLERFEDRGEGSFRRWLGQIVEHKITDVLRRYVATPKRGIQREVTRNGRPDTVQFPDGGPSPSACAVAGEMKARIRGALAGLPDDYRDVLRLVQDEGLTLAEAGGRMGRSMRAAQKLYGRALAKLTARVLEAEENG